MRWLARLPKGGGQAQVVVCVFEIQGLECLDQMMETIASCSTCYVAQSPEEARNCAPACLVNLGVPACQSGSPRLRFNNTAHIGSICPPAWIVVRGFEGDHGPATEVCFFSWKHKIETRHNHEVNFRIGEGGNQTLRLGQWSSTTAESAQRDPAAIDSTAGHADRRIDLAVPSDAI